MQSHLHTDLRDQLRVANTAKSEDKTIIQMYPISASVRRCLRWSGRQVPATMPSTLRGYAPHFQQARSCERFIQGQCRLSYDLSRWWTRKSAIGATGACIKQTGRCNSSPARITTTPRSRD